MANVPPYMSCSSSYIGFCCLQYLINSATFSPPALVDGAAVTAIGRTALLFENS